MAALFTTGAWKRLFPRLSDFFHKLGEVRYTSVPIWCPWRDY